jgi:uncharacterized protein (DUF488 family)
MEKPVIYTIGHSTRPLDEFRDMLQAHGIAALIDVRTIPRSRHNPQFNDDALAESLGSIGIRYAHMKKLGGLRHAKKDSRNMGWRNASFRGYADYMETPEFTEGLTELMATARERTTAIMCAEAVPWRCHRSLIADALMHEGWEVRDIMTRDSATVHRFTPFLVIQDGKITYPAESIQGRML